MKIKQKNKLKRVKMTSIVFFILAIVYLGIWYFAKSMINSNKVCHENHCFIVEIADNDEERQEGLMYREYMQKNKGMLFIFPTTKTYNFWMKNTIIPLDMIWIDEDFNIVDIQTAQPCKTDTCISYTPKGQSLYVLEINKGLSLDHSIKIGDKLEFKLK